MSRDAATPINRDQFETFEAMILSGQIPTGELDALLTGNPEFAAWYRARIAQRRPKET